MTRLSKEEIAELQSPEEWEEGETIQPPAKTPRAVVSVAFPREDFEAVVKAAKQHGMKTSEFIRQATLQHTMAKPREAVVVSVSGAVYTGYTAVSAPRARTEVKTNPEPTIYATT